MSYFGITRFTSGAWLVVVCVPFMILMFSKIQSHYEDIRKELKYDFLRPLQMDRDTITLVPIASVNRSSVHALEYAMANFKKVVAVSVIANNSSEEAEEAEKRLRTQWERLNSGVRLVVIHSQYRSVARRLQRFVELELDRYYDPEDVTVVVPQFITKKWWHKLLHNKTGSILMAWLVLNKSVKVVAVPYRLRR